MAELSFELFNNQLLKVVVGVNDEICGWLKNAEC